METNISFTKFHSVELSLNEATMSAYAVRINAPWNVAGTCASNLTVFCDDCKFCIVLLVSFAGFDVVTLANNHLYDFASKGANFTVQVLKRAGIKYFGISYGTWNSSQASTEHYNSAKYIIDSVIPFRITLLTIPEADLLAKRVNK